MKYHSNDRGALAILAVILVVVLVAAAGGVAAYNVSQSHHKDAQTANASPLPASSSVATASPAATPTPTPTQSDNDLIVLAARAYTSQNANDTVTGVTIVGPNAKGNVATPGAASGYEFIAHKDNGMWKVVYRGQEQPGKALGTQYGLPTDWYSTAY